MEQSLLSKLASGGPHCAGLGLWLATLQSVSDNADVDQRLGYTHFGGMWPRGKNQMRMATEVHSIAYTPPPILLKLVPALLGLSGET